MGRAVKVPQNLIGTSTTPYVILHGGTNKATGIMNTESDFKACVGVNLKWTGTLTVAPLIQYYWSPDEKSFFEDKPTSPVTGPTGAAVLGGFDVVTYTPPEPAKSIKIVITNKDTSTDLSVLAMGGSIDYTIGSFGAAVSP
jgi:hypothetical protein